LVVALHELYREAGQPGLRSIAKAIMAGDFRDTVSHEAVSGMLNGRGVPRWSKLECVVRQLAAWNAPPRDPDEAAARFLPLWQAATGGVVGPVSSPEPAGPGDASVPTLGAGSGSQDALPRVANADLVRVPLDAWHFSRDSLMMGASRWREPSEDFYTTQVRHLQDNQSSHPAFGGRSRPDSPPAMRVGVCVTCTPLSARDPTSSALRSGFLSFLGHQPVTGLVEGFTEAGDAKWEKWAGQGRSIHEAVLVGADQAKPIAWARLLLPERRMPAGWRDDHSTMLVLHIERLPWDTDGPTAPSQPLLAWHLPFSRVLEFPAALAGFLKRDLGLEVPATNPHPGSPSQQSMASVSVSLVTPHAMTDLVDIDGYQQLPGAPVSAQFVGYAVTHSEGSSPAAMAVDWMRQMCDNVLHLDDYDAAFSGLAEDATGGGGGGSSSVTRHGCCGAGGTLSGGGA
jgi:hypothetical protein